MERVYIFSPLYIPVVFMALSVTLAPQARAAGCDDPTYRAAHSNECSDPAELPDLDSVNLQVGSSTSAGALRADGTMLIEPSIGLRGNFPAEHGQLQTYLGLSGERGFEEKVRLRLGTDPNSVDLGSQVAFDMGLNFNAAPKVGTSADVLFGVGRLNNNGRQISATTGGIYTEDLATRPGNYESIDNFATGIYLSHAVTAPNHALDVMCAIPFSSSAGLYSKDNVREDVKLKRANLICKAYGESKLKVGQTRFSAFADLDLNRHEVAISDDATKSYSVGTRNLSRVRIGINIPVGSSASAGR
jgi:hypothetical protein